MVARRYGSPVPGCDPQVSFRARQRWAVFSALGSRCVRCGNADWRTWQIDHKDGGGSQHIQSLRQSPRHQDALAHPERYQLLCANCNWIKRHERCENSSRAYQSAMDWLAAADLFRRATAEQA